MKLKNSALQELYDTLVSAGVSMSPYADSPVYEAFRECDEKLSGLLVFEHIESLEKDLDDAKNQLKYFTDSRDAWRGRAKHAEKAMDNIRAELEAKVERMDEITKERDSYHDLYIELDEELMELNAKADCLREEVKWYRKHYKEKCEKIWELKAELNSIYGKDPDYESCFTAMIDGFETVELPYLRIVFR